MIVWRGRLWAIFLGAWAILTAIAGIFGLHFQLEELVLLILLGLAGILLIWGR